MMQSTESKLTEWGRWVWVGRPVPRCGSPMFAIQRDNLEQSRMPTPMIDNETACKVDKAVARLGVRDQEMNDILWLYFACSQSDRSIGMKLGMSEGRARILRLSAIAWVDAALEVIAA